MEMSAGHDAERMPLLAHLCSIASDLPWSRANHQGRNDLTGTLLQKTNRQLQLPLGWVLRQQIVECFVIRRLRTDPAGDCRNPAQPVAKY